MNDEHFNDFSLNVEIYDRNRGSRNNEIEEKKAT